ncbi:hypothetical protein [Methanobacterium alcaliphilum]|uniref:hypothetical protein n=1 Tax=Methanobacterium alcaliphilum TaxID=392018 RepID=UPI00200B6C71|nr:hypothetical protein [Methanobacterium alcaliphilum]MCK9150697.1 hypothetical protein [Methanobacterium alcaliphilum]
MVKKITAIVALAVLFMFCASIQFVEPASAATSKGIKVDHGTKYFWSGQSGNMKMTWKTYKVTSNTRKVYQTFYVKINGKYLVSWHEIITLRKVSKNRIKIIDYTDSELGPGTTVTYKKTKLSTRKYYWYKFRPQMLKNLG